MYSLQCYSGLQKHPGEQGSCSSSTCFTLCDFLWILSHGTFHSTEHQIKLLCKIHQFTHTCPLLQLLSQFISPHSGRIYGRHITGEQLKVKMYYLLWISFAGCCFLSTKKLFFFLGLCGRKQKEISKAIKKAHALGE